jgi:hypothetical protein
MSFRRHPLALLALLALGTLAWTGGPPAQPGGPPAQPAAQPPAAQPANVVLRFHNGSVVRPAALLDAVEFETKLGKLTIPASELRKVDFGFRLSEEDGRKLKKALSDLGSPRFPVREAATKTLTQLGRLAYPALLEARKSTDLETAKRVDGILKTIRARVSPEHLRTRRTDIVRTTDSNMTGQINAVILRVKSELFGEVKIPVHQLRELVSLLPGGDTTVALDAGKYGNRTSWMETEYEVQMGNRLDITVTGEIDLDPGNMLGNNVLTKNIRADGTPRLTSGEGYQPGQVIGKIGTDGPIFVIRSRYTGNPDREGKLYLRCVTIEHANNIRAAGSYQVRISAEPQ